MLPGIDGFACIRQFRRDDDVPIVVVSARDDTHDIVAALEAGADDYVVKPVADQGTVGPAAGAAPARADPRPAPAPARVLRRSGDQPGGRRGTPGRPAGAGHPDRVPAAVRAGRARRPGALPAAVAQRVWGYETGDERLVDVHVGRLRQKIEADPANPRHLVTLRGLGYKLQR